MNANETVYSWPVWIDDNGNYTMNLSGVTVYATYSECERLIAENAHALFQQFPDDTTVYHCGPAHCHEKPPPRMYLNAFTVSDTGEITYDYALGYATNETETIGGKRNGEDTRKENEPDLNDLVYVLTFLYVVAMICAIVL